MSTSPNSSTGAPHPAGTESVGSRERTFLIAKDDRIAAFSVGPLEFDWLIEQMQDDPAITVQKTLAPRNFALQQVGPSIVQSVVVATMPDEKAAELEQHPQVVLEEDYLIKPLPAPIPPHYEAAASDPTLVSPFGNSTAWQIQVRSSAGAPVAQASVYLYGQGIPAQGRTDDNGMVTLSLLNESDSTIEAIYINPLRDHWSMWVNQPVLTSGQLNSITLSSLGQSFAGFPETQLLGWGQKAMRLDHVPAALDGANLRVAVIDSGAAALTHPDLAGIHQGVDLTTSPSNAVNWTDDTIAHGSHCSGIIAGANSGGGIRGFAPAADMHAARIFPGGRISSLLDAVDYCIDQQIDVINMSLGAGGTSQILLQKLAQAREQGIACIVAAGNSGDAVQFPGSSPDVLTVAAIGQDGSFPDNSYHAQQRWTRGSKDRGFFAAQFSCHGPEIDVCGPGVAIVSAVPTNGFASWDGTSMATPHIAGLAALVLAHHPDFQTPAFRLRTAARVDRLFQILKESATPLNLGDPTRTGVGLPDAVRALGLGAGGVTVSGQPSTSAQNDAIRSALTRVRQELVLAGLLSVVTPASTGPTEVSPTLAGAASAPIGSDVTVSVNEIMRALQSLEAQMRAAGLTAA
jgi:subtilisin